MEDENNDISCGCKPHLINYDSLWETNVTIWCGSFRRSEHWRGASRGKSSRPETRKGENSRSTERRRKFRKQRVLTSRILAGPLTKHQAKTLLSLGLGRTARAKKVAMKQAMWVFERFVWEVVRWSSFVAVATFFDFLWLDPRPATSTRPRRRAKNPLLPSSRHLPTGRPGWGMGSCSFTSNQRGGKLKLLREWKDFFSCGEGMHRFRPSSTGGLIIYTPGSTNIAGNGKWTRIEDVFISCWTWGYPSQLC